ncbi:hypothetical protein QTI66_38200 [Variovorax sp. J22R133]|uniref:hypothetical protein n=1 Tax=Variovorax brevis TaxID=3053503 RepID=UPI0025789E81|nr:hypothetical protein [Variovorax sp. J22R133]MDM0117924.1 hypothetical protein [Variovorax sp. J22R133]
MYQVVYVSIRQSKYTSDPRRFFLEPASTKQRQYEALRAHFVGQQPSAEVARAFGYTPGSFQVMCRRFRHNTDPVFSSQPTPARVTSPRSPPGAASSLSCAKLNHSIHEISDALKERDLALSPTAVGEVLKAEGFAALPRRRHDERPERVSAAVEPRPTCASSPWRRGAC